jgi:hypothetical protein
MSGIVGIVVGGILLWWQPSPSSAELLQASPPERGDLHEPSEELVPVPRELEGERGAVSPAVESLEMASAVLAAPDETAFDEEAFWAENLDVKLSRFLEDPGDLGSADKLLKHCIKARLSVESRFIEELEGVPTQLPTSSEEKTWISSSGPYGHRLFIFGRLEFPEYFELKKIQRLSSSGTEDLLGPRRIDEDLSHRILQVANQVRAQLREE